MGRQPLNPAPEDGENIARVHIHADIPEGMRLRVTVEAATAQDNFHVDSQFILDSSGERIPAVIPFHSGKPHKGMHWRRFSAICAQIWASAARFLFPLW